MKIALKFWLAISLSVPTTSFLAMPAAFGVNPRQEPKLAQSSPATKASQNQSPPPSGLSSGETPPSSGVSASQNSLTPPPLLQDDKTGESMFWTPMISLLLPGFGQYMDSESKTGILFTSYYLFGATGYAIQSDQRLQLLKQYRNDPTRPGFPSDEIRDLELKAIFLGQMTLFAGELSAYDTFRRRLPKFQARGEYTFLTKDQPIEELLRAPFDFSHLRYPSTYIPLGLVALIGYGAASQPKSRITFLDGVATGAVSYQAGVGEEAFFRGYLYPYMYQKTDSLFWANFTQSTVFAAMHFSAENRAPIFQFFAGWYLAYLSRRNGFTLGQSIFVHAWWDVFALLGANAYSRGKDYEVRLPALQFSF